MGGVFALTVIGGVLVVDGNTPNHGLVEQDKIVNDNGKMIVNM